MNQKKFKKAQEWFKKYGEWSIALSRPLSIGNYISYLSGFSRVKPWRFIVLTYLGIFPWSTLLLFIGNKGSIDTIQHFLDMSQKSWVDHHRFRRSDWDCLVLYSKKLVETSSRKAR